MASATNPNLLASLLGQVGQTHLQVDRGTESRDDLGDPVERNIGVRLPVTAGIQPSAQSSLVNPAGVRIGISAEDKQLMNTLLIENWTLHGELRKMHNVVQNSKIDTAELCSMFGKLANDWSATVKEINAIHDQQKREYEERIKALEKTNEQLAKENEKLKKVIEDFKKLESEFEKQKRTLKLGQIAYKLEILVSEYVFPGEDKASKRARYGTNLKSLKGKISSLKDQSIREAAAARVEGLQEEMFEDWFLGIVKELKNSRLDTAHPDLGSYEEMATVIEEEFSDDDKREDMLTALKHLQDMYTKLERPFGQ